jgi:hypothetical protein
MVGVERLWLKAPATQQFPLNSLVATISDSAPGVGLALRVLRTITRELAILIGALLIWPILLGLVTAGNDGYLPNISYILTRIIASLSMPGVEWLTVAALIIAPYLTIQAIRAFRWSRESVLGRRMANLYFAALLGACAFWFAWKAWDLLYFMYMLGDLPEELGQFVEIEGPGVVMAILATVMAVYCFVRFLRPRAGAQERQTKPI